MDNFLEPITEATETAIKALVTERLDRFNVEPCNIESFTNSEGEPAISIGICYLDAATPISPTVTIALASALRETLVNLGEYRFPYVRHYFQDNQEILGVERACGAA